ncbi:MAG: sugar ABC transporter permease [Bacillota bacterium]|nr:sugar ABC transporter permease [Bacillota bacterium]HOB91355.1 sugar ABC transporter permease [Bacillota bacterium]HPZ54764.1 sugar ABC transporter permease [Bacillota bacterium]HQD18602.1 sugar ABC transporter permease [Bacillota bacterium]
MKLPKLGLTTKKSLKGYLYVSPFLIGFFAFFLIPLIQTVVFSLSELKIVTTGYTITPVGLDNYNTALFVDPDFVPTLTNTVINTLIDIPAILIFSFFIAVVLNQKFRGRTLARLIFFLPVILTSGVVAQMEINDVMNQALVQDAEFMLGGQHFVSFLLGLNLPPAFVQYIVTVVDRIGPVIEASAIPILIFLAGLQSIPPDLYEVADVEGITGWEKFWMITFPLVSPMILTNAIFIIINSFTSPRNEMVRFIGENTWSRGGYGVSAAMALLYFLSIGAILALVVLVTSRRVVYLE